MRIFVLVCNNLYSYFFVLTSNDNTRTLKQQYSLSCNMNCDSKMASPFQLFPEEIWGMILDQVKDPRDARNVLKAFPELDTAFQKKKYLWLLDQILPCLTTWSHTLTEKDVLNCRLVCKPWSISVDSFLENQLYFRAYHPEHQTDHEYRRNLVADLRAYVPDPPGSNRWLSHFGGTRFVSGFTNRRSLSRFLQLMEKAPPGRNPFLSRSLGLRIARRGTEDDCEPFWNSLFATLEKFGEQIWFFNAAEGEDLFNGPGRSWAWLRKCLNLLPNLKRVLQS